ncbi:hypothetical protein MMC18_003089 [Xylographa bjoerkii]|nr:hypothetical protein [Xylographa bjoerkii]
MSNLGSSISLVGQLVTSITGLSPRKDSNTIKYLEQESLSTFKDSKASRVNQFTINDRIAGLEEKFKILNNDELADALHEKVEELSRWDQKLHPEILALLLDLSDNPATKTRIEDLELLKKQPPLPQLTWNEVLADDPPDPLIGIWRTIDYAEDSSEEDEAITPDYTLASPAKPASLYPDLLDPAEFLEDYEVPIEHVLTQDIQEVQFWKAESGCLGAPSDSPFLTETQIIREILFMLMQLPTSMFQKSHHGRIRILHRYRVQRMSTEGLDDIITSFISIGQELANVHDWVCRAGMSQVLQTLQAVLRDKLQDIVALMTEIEARVLHPKFQAPVTLLSVLFEVQMATRPIPSISGILIEQQSGQTRKPFAVLESMYDGICSAESTGDEDVYKFFGALFFPCLRTYLKPVWEWIEFGELMEGDKVVFITKNEEETSREFLWSKQYRLCYDPSGTLHAPYFLHLEAQKIFTSGKSVSFARSLGLETTDTIRKSSSVAPLDLESVCRLDHSDAMRPFSERFASALNAWVNDKHQLSSLHLRKVMTSRYGVWQVLDALEYIFLSRNGAITNQVASAIFSRIDHGRISWNDQFILTELFREAYGSLDCVSIAQLYVRSKGDKGREYPNRLMTMDCLASLVVGYKLPWAIANIIKPDSEDVYQRVFILLLQVLRAKELLSRKAPASLFIWDNDRKMAGIILSLQHRLLWFVNTLHSCLTTTVLLQACSDFRTKMEKADDVDDMIAAHDEHVNRLENQCMLSRKFASTHQAIVSMLDLVVLFSDLRTSLSQQFITRADSTRKYHTDKLEASSDRETDETLTKPVGKSSDNQQLAKLRKLPSTFSSLLGFILIGLREANRNGTESCCGLLIEELAVGESD